MAVSDTTSGGAWRRRLIYLATIVTVAALTAGVVWLLFTIRERTDEAREHFVMLADLDENPIDQSIWGRNFPRQYDGYLRTVDMERTKHGGNEAIDKLKADPRLERLYAGYAFSQDFRERRGHAYMLKD